MKVKRWNFSWYISSGIRVVDVMKRNPWFSFLIFLVLLSVLYPLIGIPLLVIAIVSLIIWYKKYYKIRVETLQQLISLTPFQFERAMATLLTDLGYRKVRVTGSAGDLSRDITCEDIMGKSVMVQCKKYTNKKVGSPEMQKFIGMMVIEHKANRGIYITTADFTEPAKRLAREHNIELWDGSKLANLLIEQRKKIQHA